MEDNKQLNEEAKKMMALAGIKESDRKFLNNESFSEQETKTETQESTEDKDSDFTVIEFEQSPVEPGSDDSKLYDLK